MKYLGVGVVLIVKILSFGFTESCCCCCCWVVVFVVVIIAVGGLTERGGAIDKLSSSVAELVDFLRERLFTASIVGITKLIIASDIIATIEKCHPHDVKKVEAKAGKITTTPLIPRYMSSFLIKYPS